MFTFSKEKVNILAIMAISLRTFIQTNKMNLLDILAISSLFNIGVIILSSSLGLATTIIFITIYITATAQVLNSSKLILSTNERQQHKINLNKTITVMSIANLAGIPPSLGFLGK